MSIPKSRRDDVLRSPPISPPFQDPELKPGAPDALEEGCICDPHLNFYGAGQHHEGSAIYFPEQGCPLHGLEAIVRA
jgi:hypothetical protein